MWLLLQYRYRRPCLINDRDAQVAKISMAGELALEAWLVRTMTLCLWQIGYTDSRIVSRLFVQCTPTVWPLLNDVWLKLNLCHHSGLARLILGDRGRIWYMASHHVEGSTALHLKATLTAPSGHAASLACALCRALGVVFGDIGTSPLYTLRECLHAAGGAKAFNEANLFGILSLMFWALIMVVTVKYLTFVMRADHNGEGGIFALLAIVPERFRTRASQSGKVTAMALLAVIGASLLYGDGVITPAISVLSAVEGLKLASPQLSPFVVPLTCIILLVLFAIQRRGTGDVGKLFGPVMVVWFGTMAGLGIYHIIQKPGILAALSPHYGVAFFLPQRNPQSAHPGLGRPGRDGWRSLVRGYGPFWDSAHSSGMDVFRTAVARARLPRPRREDPA